ncbi:MAG: hypothetical protein AAF740_03495 [Bacteroidota bacterium]
MKKLFYTLRALISLFDPQKPRPLRAHDKVDGAYIQPKQALEVASPYLEEHGTYHWRKDKDLRTYITLKGKWYYIMQTNYPAKTINFYLQPAVMVHSKTAKVKFSRRTRA